MAQMFLISQSLKVAMKFKKSILLLGALVIGAQPTAQALSWQGIKDQTQRAIDKASFAILPRFSLDYELMFPGLVAAIPTATGLGLRALSVGSQLIGRDEPLISSFTENKILAGSIILTSAIGFTLTKAACIAIKSIESRCEKIIQKIAEKESLCDTDLLFITQYLNNPNRIDRNQQLHLVETLINNIDTEHHTEIRESVLYYVLIQFVHRLGHNPQLLYLLETYGAEYVRDKALVENDTFQYLSHPLIDRVLAQFVTKYGTPLQNSRILADIISHKKHMPLTIKALIKKFRDIPTQELKDIVEQGIQNDASYPYANTYDNTIRAFPDLSPLVYDHLVSLGGPLTIDDTLKNKEFFENVNAHITQKEEDPNTAFTHLIQRSWGQNQQICFDKLKDKYPIFLRDKLLQYFALASTWDIGFIDYLLTEHTTTKDELLALAQTTHPQIQYRSDIDRQPSADTRDFCREIHKINNINTRVQS